MKHKDKIPGGKADKKSPKDFDQAALAQGTKHEMEHTKDKSIAQEIAMDHLTEDAKYYEKLKQVEKSKEGFPAEVPCGDGLAGKICRHNKRKLNKSNETYANLSARREKIKATIKRLRRKKKKMLGDVKITGVKHPQKPGKVDVKETHAEQHEQAPKNKKHKKQLMVGKRGGQFIVTSGGKKKYSAKVKKALESFIESESAVQQFIRNFRSKKNG